MQQWLYCDFHIHTTWSDGKYSIDEVVALYGVAGFDVIAVTDHVIDSESIKRLGKPVSAFLVMNGDDFEAYQETLRKAARNAWEKYGMLLIPGVELTNNTDRYRILALDIKKYISPDLSVEEVVACVRRQQGRSVACHPYIRNHSGDDPSFYLWKTTNVSQPSSGRRRGCQPGRPVQCGRTEEVQLHRQFWFPRRTARKLMEDIPAVRKKRRVGQGSEPQERPDVAASLTG